MKKFPKKTEYYKSFECDFEGDDITPACIDSSYNYCKSGVFAGFFRFVLYRILATPTAFIYSKLILRDKIYGKEKIKKYKKENRSKGFFIYGNHTRDAADAFIPSVAAFPYRVYVITNSKNHSLPVIGKALPYIGSLPIPTDRRAAKSFSAAVLKRASEGSAVMIYPEAHLWPFMKDLRPFASQSFTYPVRCSLPAFTLTRSYKRHGKSFRSELYIDGPFYPDESLSPRDAREKLADDVRGALAARCALSDIEVIRYVPEEGFQR